MKDILPSRARFSNEIPSIPHDQSISGESWFSAL